MRLRWIVFVLLLAAAGLAGLLATRSLGIWGLSSQALVRPVPPGHQEIAWIAPATSGDAWERLVAALTQLQRDWPELHPSQRLEVEFDRAFLDLSAEVPEVALGFGGPRGPKLRVRWYKLSGENTSSQWVNALRQRGTPPLAIVGGDTSDRAFDLAQALNACVNEWKGAAPLFLITTATAESVVPKDPSSETPALGAPKLMQVYPGRTFRFAFTNARMVEAVLDFVKQTPQVWPLKNCEPAVFASSISMSDAWGSLSVLGAAGHLQPYFLYTLAWGDDGYSKDFAKIFAEQFAEQIQAPAGKEDILSIADANIPYSVGDQYQANPRENIAVNLFLINRMGLRDQQHLLVLPTAQRARRFLSTLCRRAPLEMRSLVVVNGDAISFNTIYRDRDVAWNILDMPVPLVFFSHRNPIDPAAGFDPHKSATGTQELLLDRDIIEALLHAGFDKGRLLDNADALRNRLTEIRWQKQHLHGPDESAAAVGRPFFDADGNRHSSTGEHIIWLQPAYEGTRNLPRATISVWHVRGGAAGWKLTGQPLEVFYNRSGAEGLAGGS